MAYVSTPDNIAPTAWHRVTSLDAYTEATQSLTFVILASAGGLAGEAPIIPDPPQTEGQLWPRGNKQ